MGMTPAGLLRGVAGGILRLQQAFHAELAREIAAIHRDGTSMPSLSLLGAAFFYGVFHAAGPGHGKVVIAGYVLGEGSELRRGLALGGAIALVQGVSAILLVTVLGVLLHLGGTRLFTEMAVLELASYALIVLIGCGMAWRAVRGEEGCGHHCEDSHAEVPTQGWARLTRRMPWLKPNSIAAVALAVGVRPCSGALIVLLFALANGVFPVGIAATLLMALGVALTISAVGIGIIAVRRVSMGGRLGRSRFGARAHKWVRIAGALLIAGSGTMLFIETLLHGGLPG
jgi:ABC-type nickel/cobalt efflux system permease component RcnA